MTTPRLAEIDYLKAWGISFVLATIGGLIVGAVLGIVFGGIMGAMGISLKFIRLVTAVLGFLASLPISYFSFRFCVTKFLLPKVTEVTASPAATGV
jgi:hypothetical protein